MSSFGDPADERTAIDLVRQFGAARSVIIDVRGDGGGTTPRQLITTLMNRPWRYWIESSPQRILLRRSGKPERAAAAILESAVESASSL